uniref:Uncharacterized protein n=1 Tax=Oryza glumipatula TaxID=40148 RepID=A0A0D9Y9S2_9ORYZ
MSVEAEPSEVAARGDWPLGGVQCTHASSKASETLTATEVMSVEAEPGEVAACGDWLAGSPVQCTHAPAKVLMVVEQWSFYANWQVVDGG